MKRKEMGGFLVASCCGTHCVPEHVSGLQSMLREGSGDNEQLCSCKNELASAVLLSVFEVFRGKGKLLVYKVLGL